MRPSSIVLVELANGVRLSARIVGQTTHEPFSPVFLTPSGDVYAPEGAPFWRAGQQLPDGTVALSGREAKNVRESTARRLQSPVVQRRIEQAINVPEPGPRIARTTVIDTMPPHKPGRGHPTPFDIPARLYDKQDLFGMSGELEGYITFWTTRYKIALERLYDRDRRWYAIWIAVRHEGNTCAECARALDVPPATVRSWYRQARLLMRAVAGIAPEARARSDYYASDAA